ncbi:MAG: hypothetical protein M1833_001268 [Piccolia ochrophora]|nr:MAG: hypothetical protein M1833_001268 [Piccolia ochrophora]
MPVRNVTLGNQNIRRGISLSVGTPPQRLAFQAALNKNNSILYDVSGFGFCDQNSSSALCSTVRGGLFDQDQSESWATRRNKAAAGAAMESGETPETTGDASQVWGTDVVHFNSTISADSTPLGIAKDGGLSMNTLGLGRNSTFMNSLLEAEQIMSRGWALFWGLDGGLPAAQMDGSLVLGGYDRAKMAGGNFTTALAEDEFCSTRLLVTISDIALDFANGTSTSLLGPARGSSQQFCITPDYPLITIPYDVWLEFAARAGGTLGGGDRNDNRSSSPINSWGMVYEADDVYDGSLTFTLAAAGRSMNFTVSNDQLIVPELYVDDSGQIVQQDPSVREVKLNSLQDINENDMPMLGQPFLTGAYLIVDYDQDTFTVAPATPTLEEDIVPFENAAGECVTTKPALPAAATATATATAAASESPTAVPSKGALAGSVIGGVCALILVSVGGYILWRKWSSRHSAIKSETFPYEMDQESPRAGDGVRVLGKPMSRYLGDNNHFGVPGREAELPHHGWQEPYELSDTRI